MGAGGNKAQRDVEVFFARRLNVAEGAGDHDKAEGFALEWLRADRDNAKPYYKVAKIKLARDDVVGALDIARRGLARLPEETRLLELAATLCHRLGDVDGALVYHRQA